ncbi:hypothetical protein D3C73_1209860 [compost metagenome]
MKKSRIELVDPLQVPAFKKQLICLDCAGQSFTDAIADPCIGKITDTVPLLLETFPELSQILPFRKSAGHADNGNFLFLHRFFMLLLMLQQ